MPILRCVDILMGQSRLWILAVFESHARVLFRQTGSRSSKETGGGTVQKAPLICRIRTSLHPSPAYSTEDNLAASWPQCAGTAVKELTLAAIDHESFISASLRIAFHQEALPSLSKCEKRATFELKRIYSDSLGFEIWLQCINWSLLLYEQLGMLGH